MATGDLFPPTDAPGPGKAPQRAFLVTNHLNLMYMLAAGLVMPPAGFGGKYYQDPLECFPGWVPLFVDKAPRAAIESSTREAGHLAPVIVELRLSGLSGPVWTNLEEGFGERRFPDHMDGSERVILVPAPLPTSWIESVIFPSADDRRKCERDAKDFGNVPLEEFKRRTSKAQFARAPSRPWPPGGGPAERTAPLECPLAAGGVMAMLLRFGNLGEQAVRACRNAFEPFADSPSQAHDHAILAGLGAWMRRGEARLAVPAESATDRAGLQNASQAKLFWDAVECLVEWRNAGRTGNAEDLLVDYLSTASAGLDPRLQAGVGKLRDTLESLTGLVDTTASELFERHDTPLAHAMTLLFLRRDCADLFEYRSDRLEEADWLAAAILFGVRDGWLNLPLRLRGQPEVSSGVSQRMAQMSHRIAGSGLNLGEAPARVSPLRELFGDASEWRASVKSAALDLARAKKWDCVRTRISLGPGQYSLTVKGGSTQIEVAGEPRIVPEVDAVRFLLLLSSSRLDPETEAKIRKKLRS